MPEVLFAREAQGYAFTRMLALGFFAALLLHLSGKAGDKKRWLGAALDLLCAAALGLGCARVMLACGDGLRAYMLCALLLGAALYAQGLTRLVRAFAIWWKKHAGASRKCGHGRRNKPPIQEQRKREAG